VVKPTLEDIYEKEWKKKTNNARRNAPSFVLLTKKLFHVLVKLDLKV
jgi:hypothetical protein